MGTVGLSFGSATSGAGFNVATTVTSILAIEQGIETPWKTQLTSLQAKDSAFTSLGTGLSSLSTALSALTNFDGVLAAKEGSSSDASVLALSSASTSAVAGSHTVVVTSLASTSSQYSAELANRTDTLSGTISLKVGRAAAQTITLGSSNNTLVSLAVAINSGSYGVTASVVSDTNGSRLSLVSNTSGSAGSVTVGGSLNDDTTSTGVAFQVGTAGSDAQLTVDGLQTTSASNTVTQAIPGVTFQLLSASPATLQVQITNDNASVVTAVQAFVTAYNSVAASVKTQEGKDATGKAEPLFGDPTLSLVQSQLAAALSGGRPSGSVSNLAQLGISLNENGQLTLDNTALESTLNSSYADVTGFLQNPNSFGQNLNSVLNGLSSTGTTGAVYLALQEDATEETGLNANVTAEDARIATDKTTLTAQLNAANEILQSIPSQLNEVNELYSSLSGYNENAQ